MKNIHQLIPDIYNVIQTKGWFNPDRQRDFDTQISRSLNQETRVPSLRLSQMGPKCPCQLWHSIHSAELAEPTKPWTMVKFGYGHLVEAYVIQLAKAAGHEVLGEQDECVVDGIVGHRDCVIDGCVVDVKSVNSRSFEKFKTGSLRDNDDFGYLDQLDAYVVGAANDPLVRNKNVGYLLAIDQELGHLKLYEHVIRPRSIIERIKQHKRVVQAEQPPACECRTETAENGNIELHFTARYNPFKWQCFPALRCFLYSSGPRYFSKVVKRPVYKGQPLPELNSKGEFIYRDY